jgi:DNA polymerase
MKKSNCEICGLFENCLSPKMKVTGKGEKKILFIAEAPGKNEDEQGEQLIGAAGQLLRRKLNNIGIDLDNDCWKTNAIICRPQKNKTPTTKQVNCCRENLLRTIQNLKPEKIIILGKVALQSLLGHRTSITSIEKWIGQKIPEMMIKFLINILMKN